MQLLQSFVVYSLALLYGLFICFRLLWETIRNLGIPPGAKRRETPPSCLLDPELGEHSFLRTASNLRIHYVAKGDPSKPLMLCLHGFPEFWYSWRYQLKAFSDNYRVVAVDMRGYGESDHPKGRDQYKMSYLVNDIKEMVAALGYKSCVLMAHDWGGFVAWSVTHIFPELVDKLIVCNIPHPKCFGGKSFLSSIKQFLSSWYMCFVQLPCLPEYLVEMGDYKMLNESFGETKNFTEEDMEAYKYALCQSGCSGPINYYRKVLSSDLPQGHTRTKIKAPTLVVWGTGDRHLMKESLKGTEQYVENVTIKYIEGAGHWVQVEDYETVNKHIRDFLNAYPRESLKKPD